MTITTGMRGIDFAFMPDPHGYAGIAQAGAGFVCRYSAGVGGADNPKCTKPGEITEAIDRGIDFIANFELAEDTPTEGAASGQRHGAADREFWSERGLAPAAGVIVSWEPGSDASQFGAVAAFLASYRSALGRPIGLYSSVQALTFMRDRQLIDVTWLSMSSAASGLFWGDIPQPEYAARMLAVARDHGCTLVQNRNRWYFQGTDANGNDVYGADEDIVVTMPAVPFSQLQATGAHPHPPAPAPAPAHPSSQDVPWPGPELGFGPDDHFGNINGPATSHGGATAAERRYVRMIQQRLIVRGFVPGHHDPNDPWADGIYDVAGNGRLDGPTTDAVKRFQAADRPGPLTSRPGEVWADDWQTLFSSP